MISLLPLAEIAEADVDALLDSAFGSDRHGRTAYKIRAGTRFLPALSFAATESGQLVGAIQCWPVALAADEGTVVPLVMVGPVAVRPDRQRDGIGRLLMTQMLAAAELTDATQALMLIGDPEYYGRLFGFTAERTALWRAPGPVEPGRLLARGAAVPAGAGLLRPAIPAIA
ncbi:GNAT family N-acetyltransferase [Sphingomonas sp. 28-63-12]|uniref:GNAT family N-acetyltransferase n=1 Tax=Sphingomonas sp. 28-63-12 TaxID=1970434 RepID=UPI000BCB03BC|nr:MAG: GNAT family N-acetyltransferase [Sphingomonas sp. 28-63-12]